MKKQFVITVWSSEEKLDLTPEEIQYEIYENISNLDTVEVLEIQNGKVKTVKLNEANMSDCFEIWDNSGNFVALIHSAKSLDEGMMKKLLDVFGCSENSESSYLIMDERDVEEFNKKLEAHENKYINFCFLGFNFPYSKA